MSKPTIAVINGPNLNLTGVREPEVYGTATFGDLLKALAAEFPQVEFSYFQSNVEGELISELHRVGFDRTGIILNAGAYTHTSVAIGDAVRSIQVPVIEVHMSNIWAREEYRHKSYISGAAKGVIAGFGLESYRLAVLSLLRS